MFWLIVAIIIIFVVVNKHKKAEAEKRYKAMETEVLQKLGFPNWSIIPYFDEFVTVKSRQALEKYDDIKFFKENEGKLQHAEAVIRRKNEVTKLLKAFLNDNDYKSQPQYNRIEKEIDVVLNNARAFRVSVNYISSAGKHLGEKELTLTRHGIDKFKRDPSLLMGKGEYPNKKMYPEQIQKNKGWRRIYRQPIGILYGSTEFYVN